MAKEVIDQVRAGLLNFALNELCAPVKNHVYEYLKTEVECSRRLVIPSALAATQNMECVNVSQGDLNDVFQTKQVNVADHQAMSYENLLSSNDADFEKVFRMNRTTMNKLTNAVDRILRLQNSPETDKPRHSGNTIPTGMKVMLTTWLMGNNVSFKKASVVFQLSKVTVYRLFHEICTILKVLAGKYIRWPTADECSKITDSFLKSCGFPGVVGVIGYHHINIREPENKEEADKFLRDGDTFHTVIVQAVVDNNLLFRDVCAGFPGKTPIIHVLAASPLFKHLSDQTQPLIQPDEHIVGTSEYPQLTNLVTPYTFNTSNRTINKKEEAFNNRHSLACQIVDFSFTVLQERFPRLNFLDVFRPELAGKVIVAACVLHNFTILEKNEWFILPSEIQTNGTVDDKILTKTRV